jgi:thiamine biosynthesis lipoprotein ApbE
MRLCRVRKLGPVALDLCGIAKGLASMNSGVC